MADPYNQQYGQSAYDESQYARQPHQYQQVCYLLYVARNCTYLNSTQLSCFSLQAGYPPGPAGTSYPPGMAPQAFAPQPDLYGAQSAYYQQQQLPQPSQRQVIPFGLSAEALVN